MRRLRILFGLFGLALLAPIALLVERAINSVRLERDMRHQVVAERVFDESERALSRFLEPEERQPFDGYLDATRSPAAPFVLGYFQIGSDGQVKSLPLARAGFNTASAIAAALARFAPQANADGIKLEARLAQVPGTTLAVGKDAPAPEVQVANQKKQEGAASAFDALRSLNKAVSERRDRARSEEEYQAAAAPPSARSGQQPAAPMRQEVERAASDLPPMVGQIASPRQLLLYRTVIRNTQGYRQGMVLGVEELCVWLRQETLTAPELAGYAELRCAAAAKMPAPTGQAYAFEHRFGDPFESLHAQLFLQPLPGVGGAAYVYALCALVALAGSFGLLALYRMVAVTVRYAEQRSNFVAAVSHELKTPLTAIRMYGEMLRDGIVPSEVKRQEYYRHITGEAERLSRLIANVLEFARLEKGARSAAVTTGSIAPVVEEVAELLRPHLEAEGFALHVRMAADLPAVPYERDALVQILANLIDNAAKYARDAVDKQIELTTEASANQLRVAVRDHGPGVAARHLSKIFEPFYRGESELTRRHKGTGIGLALVRSLAQGMGAQVAARNHPDGGLEVAVSWRFD